MSRRSVPENVIGAYVKSRNGYVGARREVGRTTLKVQTS